MTSSSFLVRYWLDFVGRSSELPLRKSLTDRGLYSDVSESMESCEADRRLFSKASWTLIFNLLADLDSTTDLSV